MQYADSVRAFTENEPVLRVWSLMNLHCYNYDLRYFTYKRWVRIVFEHPFLL